MSERTVRRAVLIACLVASGCGGSKMAGSSQVSAGSSDAGSDAESTRHPFAEGAPLSHASGIAADDTDVYWVSADGIQRQSKLGGAVQTLGTAPCGATSLALDDTYVYSSHGYTSASCPAGVSRMPKDGGPVTPLATDFIFPDWGGIVLDDVSVYFIGMRSGSDRSAAAVYAVPKVGGTAREIAGPVARGAPAVDGKKVYWLAVPGDPPDPTTPVPTSIMQTPRDGGPSRTLATLSRSIATLVFLGDRIHWVASGYHGIEYMCVDCSSPAEVQSMGPGDSKPVTDVTLDPGMFIDDAVVDATGLWLSLEGTRSGQGRDYPPNDDHTGSLIHVSADGTRRTVLGALPFRKVLAIDDDHVFVSGDAAPASVAK
jgi:hypothetical protein